MNDWKEMNQSKTLKEYIEKNAYDFLDFNPNKKDSLNSFTKSISEKSSDNSVVIRDVASIEANRPAIVINDSPILNYSILSLIKLSDVEKITLLKPNESTWAVFGVYGKIGVILVQIKKKRWRKLEKIR